MLKNLILVIPKLLIYNKVSIKFILLKKTFPSTKKGLYFYAQRCLVLIQN